MNPPAFTLSQTTATGTTTMPIYDGQALVYASAILQERHGIGSLEATHEAEKTLGALGDNGTIEGLIEDGRTVTLTKLPAADVRQDAALRQNVGYLDDAAQYLLRRNWAFGDDFDATTAVPNAEAVAKSEGVEPVNGRYTFPL